MPNCSAETDSVVVTAQPNTCPTSSPDLASASTVGSGSRVAGRSDDQPTHGKIVIEGEVLKYMKTYHGVSITKDHGSLSTSCLP
jgi:hypothetical protein